MVLVLAQGNLTNISLRSHLASPIPHWRKTVQLPTARCVRSNGGSVRSAPAHSIAQSATSRSLGQTRWRSICARFTVWNPLHQGEEVRTTGQEMRQETAQASFPARQTLSLYRDMYLGN